VVAMRRDEGINSMAQKVNLETVTICIVFASAFAKSGNTHGEVENLSLATLRTRRYETEYGWFAV